MRRWHSTLDGPEPLGFKAGEGLRSLVGGILPGGVGLREDGDSLERSEGSHSGQEQHAHDTRTESGQFFIAHDEPYDCRGFRARLGVL